MLGRLEKLEVQELQVKGDQMEKMEREAPPVHLAQLVLQGREESRDLRECLASRVCPEHQAHLESQESQVTRVLQERLGKLALQDQEEREVLQEKEVKLGPMGCRDPKVVQVHPDQMG